MKALSFEHSGNGIFVEDFEHHFCLAFQLTADLLIDDGTIRQELTGARLGLELKFITFNEIQSDWSFSGRGGL